MMRRSPAPALEAPPALIAGLVELIRATVRAEARASQEGDGDPWVAIDTYLDMTRREASELARGGEIEGARKIGKRWRARRSACDSAIERIGLAPPAPRSTIAANDGDEDQGADGVLAELGLTRVPEKASGRR